MRNICIIIVESKVSLESIVGIGISTQRGSFTTWNSKDGRHYHKWVYNLFLSFSEWYDDIYQMFYYSFITWKDLRADNLVKEWNSSIIMKILKMGSKILYTFSRNKRFLGMSVFKFMNTQVLSLSLSLFVISLLQCNNINNNPFNWIRPVGFKSKDRKWNSLENVDLLNILFVTLFSFPIDF